MYHSSLFKIVHQYYQFDKERVNVNFWKKWLIIKKIITRIAPAAKHKGYLVAKGILRMLKS
jgi:hypothetical protein